MLTLKKKELPDVAFVETDINKILTDMIKEYEEAYFASTGERKKLRPGDPIRIFLYTQALRELQLRIKMNDSAKQNLLAFSRGENIDHLGAFSKTERFEATAATVPIKFTLSEARPSDETIIEGTRVSPDSDLYFVLEEDLIVEAGVTEIETTAKCLEKGTIGNGFTPGQINILVDPIPWVQSVENTEESSGGSDKESDDSLRERIHLAPEGFSVAGPEGAYEYFVRQFSNLIEDTRITSPSEGVVDIRVLLQNGELPTSSFLKDLDKFLSDKERRPLTDNVAVSAPDTVSYDLDVTYYIRSSDSDNESKLRDSIEKAIDGYITWQKSKIGRDINPSELISLCIKNGAKRVYVMAPNFTVVDRSTVGVLNSKIITYGGMEDE